MRVLPILLALLLLAGALAPGMAVSQVDNEMILRVALQDDIKGTNPFTTDDDYWTVVATQWMYDTPMFSGPDGLIPYIAIGSANVSGKADSWEDCDIGNFGYSPASSWADSGKKEAIIFYDFENVKWHNGTQMDIRDVMFSYHAMAQNPYWRGDVDCIMGDNYSEDNWLHIGKVWESGNKAALRFTLQTPYWQFFNRTLAVRLLPEHVWAYKISGQNVDGAKIWCDAGYNQTATDSWQISLAQKYENPNPVGSGPLMWKNWTKGQYIDISTWRGHFFKSGYRYEEYCLDEWGGSPAVQPLIDGIHYRIYKTAEAAVLALKSNDIDYISWTIPVNMVQELANVPGVWMQQSMDPGFTHLAYNMRNPSFGYNVTGEDTGKPLRRAIAHCTDKNRIVTRTLYGLGITGNGPVISISPWYNKTIPRYPFDPDEAKRILANAGYQVKKADGTLVKGDAAIAAAGLDNWWVNPDGSGIGSSPGGKISIISPNSNYDPVRAQAVLLIAQSLRDAGIYAESEYDWGSAWNRIQNRDFDIFIGGWKIGSQPPDYLHAFFHSDNAAVGYNYPGYRNESFDEIIELARSTDNDAVRKSAVFEAQAAICYDLPYDVLCYRTNIEAYRSRFGGWEVDSSGTIFNLKSIRSLRVSGLNLIAQFVSPPSAVRSNETVPLSVVIKDSNGNPVEGATVYLNASAGTLSAVTGETSSNGRFDFHFNAPYADPFDMDSIVNGTPVIIQVTGARYTDESGMEYEPPPSKSILIRVFPGGIQFLSVSLMADPDIISPDMDWRGTPGFTYVDVTVRYGTGEPVAGANVALMVSPDVPDIEPKNMTTDAEGIARFRVTAVDLPDNDGSVKEYTLTAVARHPTDSNLMGENLIYLSIVDALPSEPQPVPPFSGYPVFEVTVTLIAILAVAGIYAVVRRRKKL